MDSDHEGSVPSSLEISERETQFVPQEDDAETLWEVIEITAEKGPAYKVKWAGLDPKTRKPWAQSWVPKRDCTDRLVMEWKRKQALKKKEAARKSAPKRVSGSSKAPASRASILSKDSTGTSSTITKRPSISNATVQLPPATANGKRSRGSDASRGGALSTSRPRKKRRLEEEMDEPEPEESQESHEVKSSPKFGKVLARQDDNADAETANDAQKRSGSMLKVGPPRKQARAESDHEVHSTELPTIRKGGKNTVSKAKEFFDKARKSVNSTSSTTSSRKTPATKRAVPHPPLHTAKTNGKFRAVASISTPSPEGVSEDEDEQSNEILPKKRPTSPLPRLPSRCHFSRTPPLQPHESPQPRSSIDSRLSPDAIERLQIFDAAMAELETLKDKSGASPAPRGIPSHNVEARGISHPSPPAVDDDGWASTAPPWTDPSPTPPLSIIASVPIKASSAQPVLHGTEGDFDHDHADARPPKDYPPEEPPSPETQNQPLPAVQVSPEAAAAAEEVHAGEDSYRQEVVPETETESANNTQSQSQQSQDQPRRYNESLKNAPIAEEEDTDLGADKVSNVAAATTGTQPGKAVTPLRASGSLISKMKPRTPGSMSKALFYERGYDYDNNLPSAIQEEDEGERGDDIRLRPRADSHIRESDREQRSGSLKENGKNNHRFLKPIPQLSPSQFTPHLLMTSSISQAEEVQVEEPMSSIEQFSSPEKGGVRRGRGQRERTGEARTAKGKERAIEDEQASDESDGNKRRHAGDVSLTDQDDDDDDDLEMIRRGMQLAEKARREKKAMESKMGLGSKRVVLTDLLTVGRQNGKGKGKESELKIVGFRPRLQNGSRLSESEERDESRTQDDVPSFSRESDSESRKVLIEALREEVEESTQDVLAAEHALLEGGLEGVAVDVEMGEMVHELDEGEIVTATPGREDYINEVPGALGEEIDLQPQIMDVEYPVVEEVSSPSSTHSREKSRSRSGSGQRGVSIAEVEPNLILPSTAPEASSRPDTPELSQEVIDKSEPRHLGAAMALLNVKSREISRLEGLLLAEQAKTAAFLQEIKALQEALENAKASGPEQEGLAPELTEVREQLAQEKASHEKERTTLVASVTNLTRQKEGADRDREFFREQYMKASGFVSAVRAENDELEKRALVAEEQAKTGVEVIKQAFEQRIAALEDDKRSWKRLALFAVEKDQRTNDDIRRRAAEEPQLRARVEELEEEHHRLLEQTTALEDDLESRETHGKELERENLRWKIEVSRLNSELGRLKANLSGYEADGREDPDEMVYQCHWRPEDGNIDCGKSFASTEDLRAHLYNGAHLGEDLYH